MQKLEVVVDNSRPPDGFVSWMLYAFCEGAIRHVVGGGPRYHIVGTRLSPETHGDVTAGDIQTAKRLLEPVAEKYSVVIRTRTGNGDDIVIAAFAPTQLSEEEFTDVVEAFKLALRTANVVQNPMDCPLPSPVVLTLVK